MADKREKIAKIERVINDEMKTELKKILDTREAFQLHHREYEDLKKNLTGFLKNKKVPRTRVDIGCNFFLEADITDHENVIMDIGCNVWLPMAIPEAINFCDYKLTFYSQNIQMITENELKIKSEISFMLEALREIQGLPQPAVTRDLTVREFDNS